MDGLIFVGRGGHIQIRTLASNKRALLFTYSFSFCLFESRDQDGMIKGPGWDDQGVRTRLSKVRRTT